jgi:hypothetical protein
MQAKAPARLCAASIVCLAGGWALGGLARAQTPLDCGHLNPHAQVLAYAKGQPLAQSTDMTEHALPWTGELDQPPHQARAST